ncbi:glycosyltransferase involved in cell wall biosynthesis [Gelidibacter algens]|uniref:Glycosyltransferase involved in cell wall biosynthesis n=1 Tax=Gelidibacter algens TaxID=49280 RepID=A0A1A7QY72_9FLAO|nr:glycosyltransferase family 1 protein [Gelidibacter algens]OBX24511.1 glycosyl transferase family 1 [Gelidibacter algens]RAJ25333.1 glycosyltransferase involved in cell wall biosynthesis [Gelidibacter algens]
MKIGFDAKRAFHNRSGLGNYSRDLIRMVSHFYPENQYVLYNPKPGKVAFQLDANTEETLPNTTFWRFLSSFWRQKAIIKQLKEDTIDIYHGLTGEIPRGIQNTKIKTIVTIHDLIFAHFPELYKPIDRKIYRNKFQYAADHSDMIIAISEQTKKDIVRFLHIDPKRIKVIYQGCNAAYKKSYSNQELNQTSSKFNLPKKFILNVGTVEKRKNLLNLVKAIENLNCNLVVVGNDKSDYAQEIRAYINAKGLTNRVHFLKNVNTEELAQIYQMASVFVYPSIFEGFGIPIIEALFSKTPVITSKESCFSEAGGPDSIYIDPNDPRDIEAAIQIVLEDEELRDKMNSKGLDYAQQFNDNVIAKHIYETYKALHP